MNQMTKGTTSITEAEYAERKQMYADRQLMLSGRLSLDYEQIDEPTAKDLEHELTHLEGWMLFLKKNPAECTLDVMDAVVRALHGVAYSALDSLDSQVKVHGELPH
jgi:hypothetical protein